MDAKKRPAIVYITDDDYVDYTLTSIKSVLINTSLNIKIYVICYSVKGYNKQRLSIDERIKIIEYTDKTIKKYGRYRHISVATYIKFDIPELINEDVCLYIDGDTIIVNDITNIFEYDVTGYIAAVMEDFGRHYIWGAKAGDAFYAGTMLLNLTKMREEKISNQLHEEKLRHIDDETWNEQDIFNKVFEGKVLHIPIRYCVSLSKIRYSSNQKYRDVSLYNSIYGTKYKTIEELIKDAAILHFHGEKPKEYEHKDIYRIVDNVEESWLNRTRNRTFIFSNVCRFEDAEEFEKEIRKLSITNKDTLIFLNTAKWLSKFEKRIPDANIKTIHRFKRNGGGWWGLREVLDLRDMINRRIEVLLIDNKGHISNLYGKIIACVGIDNYPESRMPTTGFFAFKYATQYSTDDIYLINFYGNSDTSTPHYKPHGWDYEEKVLRCANHISLEPMAFKESETGRNLIRNMQDNIIKEREYNRQVRIRDCRLTIIPRVGSRRPASKYW